VSLICTVLPSGSVICNARRQHAAWRHLKVDRPGGTFRGDPGVPFGYLARLQRALAAGPRA